MNAYTWEVFVHSVEKLSIESLLICYSEEVGDEGCSGPTHNDGGKLLMYIEFCHCPDLTIVAFEMNSMVSSQYLKMR